MSMLHWDKNQEDEFKAVVKKFFSEKIEKVLNESDDPLRVGDDLGAILRSSDEEMAEIVTPRAVKKWASPETIAQWEDILRNPRMMRELRVIGRSIANTMRPLAGNNFALWVAKVLNAYFLKNTIPLKAITSGKIKGNLSKELVIKPKGLRGTKDYKPDIDIVLVRTDKGSIPVAIISAKTTLAERVMQTISWFRYVKTAPARFRSMKIFLVTAWDTFESGTNRDRVQELDGVYVCNKKVKEHGRIKLFSKILTDIEKLSH